MKVRFSPRFSFLLKVAIVSLGLFFISSALIRFFNEPDRVAAVYDAIRSNYSGVILVVLLMPVNWLLESMKWKVLVSITEKIKLKESVRAVLCGVAIGSGTPNRVGEFAGKVFQLRHTPVVQGLTLAMISSAGQVIITVSAGIAGMLFLDLDQIISEDEIIRWAVLVFVILMALFIIFRFFGSRITPYFRSVSEVGSGILLKVLLFSAIRYAVYAFQFVWVLRSCGVHSEFFPLLAAVSVHYLMITIIPTVFFTELLVRGSVAVSIIGVLFSAQDEAGAAAFLIWIINVLMPSLAGLWLVGRMKFSLLEKDSGDQ